MNRMLRCLFLLALAAPVLPAKVAVVFRLASPPLPAGPGHRFSLCAANVGVTNVDLTLQFILVRTGAIVATRDVTLLPPGHAGPSPDPCLETAADALPAAAPGSGPPLIVALVVIRRGLFSRASAATASVQITAPDPSGTPRLVSSIPLMLATLVNGRNTPIEQVH